MRASINLSFAVIVLLAGCNAVAPPASVASSAPSCSVADELLYRVDGINENVGMRQAFLTDLQTLPDKAQASVMSRIDAKVVLDGARMSAPEDASKWWIALLLLSTKSEVRGVKDYRYCNGDFDLGSGQAFRWAYSVTNGRNGPEMRITKAEIVTRSTATRAARPLGPAEVSAAEPVAEEPSPATASVPASAPEQGDEVEREVFSFRDTLKDGGYGPELVEIPAGSFMMGSPTGEGDSDERPQHRVTVRRFAFGKYAVTFDEYDRFARSTGRSLPSDAGWGRGTRPAINVRWADAQAYARWLTEQTGEKYRLPSESEWEYATRAGTTGLFSFSGPASPAKMNYNSARTDSGDRSNPAGFRGRTVHVGSLPANPMGLHEVHGNVWEWVEDCYHNSYAGAPIDGSSWTDGCTSATRVMRGGAWNGNASWARSANRNGDVPSFLLNNVGIRLVRVL